MYLYVTLLLRCYIYIRPLSRSNIDHQSQLQPRNNFVVKQTCPLACTESTSIKNNSSCIYYHHRGEFTYRTYYQQLTIQSSHRNNIIVVQRYVQYHSYASRPKYLRSCRSTLLKNRSIFLYFRKRNARTSSSHVRPRAHSFQLSLRICA